MTDEQIKERTLQLGKIFVKAMTEAIEKAGSQKKLSEKTGIHQSRISDYANGNYDFSSLSIGTLIKLFPDIEMVYTKSNSSEKYDSAIEIIEERMLTLFRRLRLKEQILCYENMARAYGDTFDEKIIEETKK